MIQTTPWHLRKAECKHPDGPRKLFCRKICNACYLHWERLLKKGRPGLARRFLRETIAGTAERVERPRGEPSELTKLKKKQK